MAFQFSLCVFWISCVLFVLSKSAEARSSIATHLTYSQGMSTFSMGLTNASTGSVLTRLLSGELYVHSRGRAASLVVLKVVNSTGIDGLGFFISVKVIWGDASSSNSTYVLLETESREYPDRGNVVVFTQRYPNGAVGTSTGNKDGVASSFPSLLMENPELGFVHFSGFMAGHYPQYGKFSSSASSGSTTLAGGMKNSGALCLFLENLQLSLVISPISSFMSSSLYVHAPSSGPRVAQWGIMGGATSIPAGFESSFVLAAFNGGINAAMKKWGSLLLEVYGKTAGSGHERDLTLQYVGYSTDNGAFYYYYQGNHSNYQETIVEVTKYAEKVGLPYAYIQLDSWWYYQGIFEGVKNWTALPDVFPGGMAAVHNSTKLPIQAHNRYWAMDNVYASNPQFPVGPTLYSGKKYEFTWGSSGGLPNSYEFWDDLFAANSNWGLRVYEQDWLSTVTDDLPALQENVTFGQDWLLHMGKAAEKHGLSIQYCMSYPRHVFTSLFLQSVSRHELLTTTTPNHTGRTSRSGIRPSLACGSRPLASPRPRTTTGRCQPISTTHTTIFSLIPTRRGTGLSP